MEEGRRVEAAPRGSPRRRGCGVPAPSPSRRDSPGLAAREAPFPPALRRGRSAGVPARVPRQLATRGGASSGGPGSPDLGCPQGWASDLSPSAAAPATFREQVSGVAVKFTTGIGGEEQKLAPSQVFIPFGPLRKSNPGGWNCLPERTGPSRTDTFCAHVGVKNNLNIFQCRGRSSLRVLFFASLEC